MATPSLLPDQAVLAGLAALAVEFIAIGRVLREERTFRFLGAALGILCLMLACDVFIVLPGVGASWGSKPLLDAFQLAFQALACAFAHVGLRFLRDTLDRPSRGADRSPRLHKVRPLLLGNEECPHYPSQVRNAPVSICTKSERW